MHVRLLNESVDVWRPVEAERLSEATYRLSATPAPDGETWSFGPGEIVVAEHRSNDPSALVAVARASHFDERSRTPLPLAS